MAAEITIDAKARLVRVTFPESVSLAEMYEGRKRIVSDPAFDPTFSQLVDARAARSLELNGYNVKQFAQEHIFAPGTKRAIVLSRAPYLGLARMFQIYRQLAGGGEEIQIFNDMETAMRWLGISGEFDRR